MTMAPQRFERIAVEEGFTLPEMVAVRARTVPPRSAQPTPMAQHVFRSLADLGEGRIKAMDEDGIACQVCVVAGIGIQDIDPVEGNELCALANDRMGEATAKYPGRLFGVCARRGSGFPACAPSLGAFRAPRRLDPTATCPTSPWRCAA